MAFCNQKTKKTACGCSKAYKDCRQDTYCLDSMQAEKDQGVCVTCLIYMCVTWLVYMCVLAWLMSMCVTWLGCTCAMWLSRLYAGSWGHVWLICGTWLIDMCDVTHSYVWHDSFICVTTLIHRGDVTHSYVWHGPFICVTWPIHMVRHFPLYVQTHLYV